jgi:hypothetical protein
MNAQPFPAPTFSSDSNAPTRADLAFYNAKTIYIHRDTKQNSVPHPGLQAQPQSNIKVHFSKDKRDEHMRKAYHGEARKDGPPRCMA